MATCIRMQFSVAIHPQMHRMHGRQERGPDAVLADQTQDSLLLISRIGSIGLEWLLDLLLLVILFARHFG